MSQMSAKSASESAGAGRSSLGLVGCGCELLAERGVQRHEGAAQLGLDAVDALQLHRVGGAVVDVLAVVDEVGRGGEAGSATRRAHQLGLRDLGGLGVEIRGEQARVDDDLLERVLGDARELRHMTS